MTLRWAFLLVLAPLLASWEQKDPHPEVLEDAPLLASWEQKDPHPEVLEEASETARCQQPQWDPRLHFAPEQRFYRLNEELTLSCLAADAPPLAVIRCAKERSPDLRDTWEVRTMLGAWHHIAENLTCVAGKCPKPQGDHHLRFSPKKSHYELNEELTLTCPGDLEPSFTHVRCAREFLQLSSGKPVYDNAWWGRNSTGGWIRTGSSMVCIVKCPKPQWDSRLQLTPEQQAYRVNEEVKLSCPEGYQPSLPQATCKRVLQIMKNGRHLPKGVWREKSSTGNWMYIQRDVECIELLQVVPGSWEVSATSIKLNWTCRFPDACQHMRATCQLVGPAFPTCEAEDVRGEKLLRGQKGTFTCAPLQPFTVYSITISLPPSTVLFTWQFQTEEMVPDKPENLSLDPSTGSLRWNALPSCKGEILGYQLGITARSTREGSFLEIERLRLNSSVTEYRLPDYRPGRTYVVTVQGLTAAGGGDVSRQEFLSSGLETTAPLNVSSRGARDISRSQGTAVLPLRPITQPHEAVSQDAAAVAGACSEQLPPFNASLQHRAYVAAVLNLTAPTDFVLGDGTRRHGYYNAPLQPDWNYTALLRLVRRRQQAEKFTCVCYSFSVGQEPVPQLDSRVVIMAVALVVALLALGILLLFLLFRRKRNSSQTYESNSTIPLRRCRRGANKMNTRIPVEELLEALKRFKREEVEAEQTEDESVINREGAGRLGEYQKLVSTLLHPCDAGKELCNEGKNRYKSIIPYDHCRVVLQPSDTGNGYINASYVESYQSPRFFIAAQGPLPGTVVDFWQMVWQEKTSVIVMLTSLVEQNKTKCEQYWPEQEQVYGDFTVTLSNTRTTSGLVTRIFHLQKAGCDLPRLVEQFHYLLWPDHGVPRNPAQLLCLVEKVNKRVSEDPAGPVLVHCSAGIGRTGTFIALDFLLKMAKAEGKVDVFRCVQRLREQRVSMVQTKEQYTFLYEVLLEGLLCGSTGVPVENVISHISSLREAEIQRQNNILEKEFKALQKFSELFQLLPCKEAEKPSNQPKNRKPGILPADSCRPVLMSSLNADGSPRYINAVFADTYTEEDRFIITQLPFLATLVDFWALVWDYTCTSVVVLNQLQELDQTYVEFWPTQGETIYGCFHVQLISEEPGAGFTVWTLALTNKQQPKKSALKVQFCQLEDWPMQQCLPPCPATIISLLGKVETHQHQSQGSHVLVTCWDGASRSGIFCASSFLCEQIQSEGQVDVSQAVRMLKRRRRQLVKDVEQYRLCYELALSYLNSFETYGNFK
ncbi:receptor-type tyrosine-protein phosphatase mu isoform X3 [Struthio camelus]|uniref:receptor-type tyrosine-protein phosphatase mu isoform X3 n=1 Tax=Struthio camelus TaxID=8801 RepID=UPI0036040612